MATTIRTYGDLLSVTSNPAPYPYEGRAHSGGWDGGTFDVVVRDHKIATEEYRERTGIRSLVLVEFPSGDCRWLGAGVVELPGPLSITIPRKEG